MFRRKYFGFVELPCLDRRKRKGISRPKSKSTISAKAFIFL